jgi:transposase
MLHFWYIECMNKNLFIIKQLHSIETLKEKWEKSTNHIEKVRWQALYLLKLGKSVKNITSTLDRCERWLYNTVLDFNRHGSEGVLDKRKDNGGSNKLLDEKQEEELRKVILSGVAPDGGLWSGVKVTKWIADKTGKNVSTPRGWKYTQKLGLSLITARPRHKLAATPKEQRAFKKN